MKRYFIHKIVFANNVREVMDMEKGGEITSIELLDEIKFESDIGFTKTNGNGKRD